MASNNFSTFWHLHHAVINVTTYMYTPHVPLISIALHFGTVEDKLSKFFVHTPSILKQ